MTPAQPDNIQAAVLRHWRRFVPVWLFPVFVFFTPFLPGFREHAVWYVMLAVGCFVAYSLWAVMTVRRGGITKLQEIVLLAIIPFGIWCSTVLIFWFGVRFLGDRFGSILPVD